MAKVFFSQVALNRLNRFLNLTCKHGDPRINTALFLDVSSGGSFLGFQSQQDNERLQCVYEEKRKELVSKLVSFLSLQNHNFHTLRYVTKPAALAFNNFDFNFTGIIFDGFAEFDMWIRKRDNWNIKCRCLTIKNTVWWIDALHEGVQIVFFPEFSVYHEGCKKIQYKYFV